MRWVLAAASAVCLWGLLTGPAAAQPGNNAGGGGDAEQLRSLIETLQEKIDRLDAGPVEESRVTQLGRGSARYIEEEPQFVVKIYDLSDLFALAPPYPAMHADDFGDAQRPVFPAPAPGEYSGGAMGMGAAGMGGVGGGMFNLPGDRPAGARVPRQIRPQMVAGAISNDSARTSIDQLIEAITSTIAPTEWDDVGGQGSIAPLGNELLISATKDMHEQIDALLNTFRKRWGTLRTVSVQANWLWLTQNELARVLAAGEKPSEEIQAFGLVDDEAWRAIREHVAAPEADRPASYHAVVTCYNGQTVHAVSGGETLAVTGMIPVVDGGKTGPGYQPVVATIQTGAAIQVTPIVTISGKYVVLDVHSRVVQCAGPEAAAAEAAQANAGPEGVPLQLAAALDRPHLKNHRLATTLRLPVGRRMLIGGMTFEGQPSPGQPGLYLFVKALVQELRDEATERSTGTEPGAADSHQPKKPKAKTAPPK